MNRIYFLLFLWINSVLISSAQIPFGVTAKQIVVNHTIDVDLTLGFDNKVNKLTESYEYVPGNRIGVHVNQIEYELRFWNVGKLGGTSGMLWWKKDYADATLTIRLSIDNPGFVVGDPVENKLFNTGTPAYPMEPATGGPDVDDVVYSLTFTGGPNGEFDEKPPFREGTQLIGRMPGTKIYFSFKDNQVNIPGKITPRGLYELFQTSMTFPANDFSDWGKKEALDLTLCPVRFCGISGTVEVRHEAEDTWSFAKYDMDLFNGDHIRIGEESSAILSFPDLSTYALKEGTEIVITWSTEDQSKIILIGGRIIANIKKMTQDGRLTQDFETSQAAMSIKGTTFVFETNQYITRVKVIEGTVSFTSKADGKTTLVSTDQMGVADTSGLHEVQTIDLAQEKAEWEVNKAYVDSHPVNFKPISTNSKTEIESKPKAGLFTMIWLIILAIVLLVALIFFVIRKRLKKKITAITDTPSSISPTNPAPYQPHPTSDIPLPTSLRFCPQCGAPFIAGKKFCGKCGFKIHS